MRLLLALLALVAFAAPARAQDWIVDRASSAITLEVGAFGGRHTGAFGRYDGTIRFDPAQPDKAAAAFRVEAGSLVMRPSVATARATGPHFLDAARHPDIRFELRSLRPLGGARYTAEADVTIKGRTRRIAFPADLRTEGRTAQMTGGFDIDREAFGIGTEGVWNRLVARQVRINVRLTARRAG